MPRGFYWGTGQHGYPARVPKFQTPRKKAGPRHTSALHSLGTVSAGGKRVSGEPLLRFPDTSQGPALQARHSKDKQSLRL